ncbi:MAG: uroporphyrinogen decarboxylase family protein [bacterium]
MTNRERALAVLRYQDYDRLPVVHFGYWWETLQKWVAEGHLTAEEVDGASDGSAKDTALSAKLGFDFNWQNMFNTDAWLRPGLDRKVVAEFPDGSSHVMENDGVVYWYQPGAGSIPAHVDYVLKTRDVWERDFKWRLRWSEDRMDKAALQQLTSGKRDNPLGLYCGSLYGKIRTTLTFEGSCYLQADDEALFTEIIDTTGELCYQNVKFCLESGAKFDFAHFWEDICFKNGPCISPNVFMEKIGPHYKRITELLRKHGVDICSVDCDGWIDALMPTWIENGVNTMFPIEVGTWNASIEPWRTKLGKGLKGVGGMNKTVFSRDRAAVDAEVERLKRLVALGGYIPCPDHRIAPDAKWDMVRYYCDRMREEFV